MLLLPLESLPYKHKRYFLLSIAFSLFLFIFYRGFTLQEVSSITDRVRFHAIPIAISVLYHHHPHDYTGLHALAMPFQGVGETNTLINAARKQIINEDKATYYWVADDRGFTDYVIAAFYIFGPKVTSLYLMWYLILLVSSLLYLSAFGRQLWAIGFLCVILLAIHLSISSMPLAAFHRDGNNYLGGVSVYEPRFLDVLAIIAVIHMMLLAALRRSLNWIKDIVPFLGQLLLFILLYHARSSLGWEALCIYFICIFFICTQLYRRSQENILIKSAKYYGIIAPVTVILMLSFSLISLDFYKHRIYNANYFSEMGARTFWHNALMGLAPEDAFLSTKYNLQVDDALIARSVIRFARDSQKCTSDIAQLEPQVLLNSLGGHTVVNWVHYENCAKSYFFSIIYENKLRIAKLFIIRKPLASLHAFLETMKGYGVPLVDNMRAQLNIGWYPLSPMNLGFFLCIFILSFKSLIRVRKKLLVITIITMIFSLIPSIAFYPGILTLGGLLITSGILFYLLLTIGLQQILNWFRGPKHTNLTSYPMVSKKLSILIPAFNEEKSLTKTIHETYHVAKKILDDFEIIVVDDGSTDSTYQVAVGVTTAIGPEVTVIRQQINQGVGAAFHLGLMQAKFPQLCLIPGDNAYEIGGIELLFSQCGLAPLVISYRQNMEARAPLRRLLSRIATMALRMITGFKIRDAHSLYLFPVEETRRLGVKPAGYGYHIEILSRLLNRLRLFSEVPVILNPKPDESSGVMKPRTLLILGITISKLFGLRLIGRL